MLYDIIQQHMVIIKMVWPAMHYILQDKVYL
jgi:hypothetical protein